jgi:hypothetical protein
VLPKLLIRLSAQIPHRRRVVVATCNEHPLLGIELSRGYL